MRGLVKIFISLAFIAGSFWVGKYTTEVKFTIQVKENAIKVNTNNKLIHKLRDSISALNFEMAKEKAKNNLGSAKLHQIGKKK